MFLKMGLQKPESMEECIYFTQRSLADSKNEMKGEIMVWVFKGDCPKCGKAKMGKPRDASGKVKIRATEYICPACSHTVDKENYEDSLMANADYTCPECSGKGETQVPYVRKNIEGVKTLRFNCKKCKGNLDVTKKMKEKKGKKKGPEF